jgi:hypothetical protein
MYFLGIGEHNNTYGYEHMCFNILQYKVPCGVNNTVTVQAFYLDIFANETVSSVSVNSTSVSTIHILINIIVTYCKFLFCNQCLCWPLRGIGKILRQLWELIYM